MQLGGCEDAALQWMNHSMLFPETLRSDSQLLPANFCFHRTDAVWLRRQLHRWRLTDGSQDPDRCTISKVDAYNAYGIVWAKLVRPYEDILAKGTWPCTSNLVSGVARVLFDRDPSQPPRHAADFARQLEEGRAQRSSGLSAEAHKQLLLAERAATDKWKVGRATSTSILLLLPVDVARHSVLSFLDFEQRIDLRVLSHSLRPLLDSAAVAQLNQLHPSGLATIARQEAEKAQEKAERARAKAEKEREKGKKRGKEEKQVVNRKRQRADESSSSEGVVATSSASALSPATASTSTAPPSTSQPATYSTLRVDRAAAATVPAPGAWPGHAGDGSERAVPGRVSRQRPTAAAARSAGGVQDALPRPRPLPLPAS